MKLSICIPTLNRARFIGETLESIVSQATDEVEIVIVDGGSTDNTAEIVAQFQQRFSPILYFRPDGKSGVPGAPIPSNGGFDRDCDRAVRLASGEFCWLFTDDDILKPGAIGNVLAAVREHYDLVVVNAEVRSSDLSAILEPARLKLAADHVYDPTESQQLFSDVCAYLSFVGGVVIHRELWISRQAEPYIGTGFMHIGKIFQSPIPKKTLVLVEPLIAIRYGDAQYMRTSRYFEIWMFTWPNLIWGFPHYSDAAKRAVCLKEPWRRVRTLLLFRAVGAYSSNEYNQWFAKRLDSGLEKLIIRSIASFPGRIANLMGIAYYYITNGPPGQFLLDLTKSPYYFARPLPGVIAGAKNDTAPIAAASRKTL